MKLKRTLTFFFTVAAMFLVAAGMLGSCAGMSLPGRPVPANPAPPSGP